MNDIVERESTEVAEVQNPSAISLISSAISHGAGSDQIDKLIELVKFNDSREALRAFNQAFTVAQASFPTIAKTREAHNNKYAPYPKIVEAIRPKLEENGFSFRHTITDNPDGSITVTCVLAHKDGHSESSSLSSAPDSSGGKNAIQGRGSAVTYLKRYTLEAVTGLVTDDQDDDGNLTGELITDNQEATIRDMIASAGLTEKKVLDSYSIESLSSLPATKYNEVVNKLKARLKAKAKK